MWQGIHHQSETNTLLTYILLCRCFPFSDAPSLKLSSSLPLLFTVHAADKRSSDKWTKQRIWNSLLEPVVVCTQHCVSRQLQNVKTRQKKVNPVGDLTKQLQHGTDSVSNETWFLASHICALWNHKNYSIFHLHTGSVLPKPSSTFQQDENKL
jgi:hypothetical protein